MSKANADNEKIIKDLKSKVVEVSYSESINTSTTKLDKVDIWKKAKEVGKHLNDDNIPTPTPSRA